VAKDKQQSAEDKAYKEWLKTRKDAADRTADLSGRAAKLYSATQDLDSTVMGFQELGKNVKQLGGTLKTYSDGFKKSLSGLERSKLEIFQAAQGMVEANRQAIGDMMGWSKRSKFVLGEIADISAKALDADASEARQLRKDLLSMKSAAEMLTGKQKEIALEQIAQGEKALANAAGSMGIVAESFRKKFGTNAEIVEKMLGGGAIGGMVGTMMKIRAERAKAQKMRDLKAASLADDRGDGGRFVEHGVDPTLATEEKQLSWLEKIARYGKASLGIEEAQQVSAIEAEEAKREGAEVDARTMSEKIVDSASAFSVQIRNFLWDGLIVPASMFLWKSLIIPIGGFLKTWLLIPLKKLFWDFLLKPLWGHFTAFLAKYWLMLKESAIGKKVGGALGGIKDKWAAAAGKGKGGGLMGAAKGVTDKAGKATKAAPKKGVLKRLADGVKAFGDNKVLRGALNIGILALSLLPLALALKMFSSGVTLTGVVTFALSLGVLIGAVQLLSKMQSQVIQGAFAIGILALAMIPLAFGLNLMKGVGIGTIFVLAGALIVLGVAANIFGGMAANPFFWLGILAIAALGVALLPLAIAMKIAAEAFEIFLGSLDVDKMMMLGPMLFFAAPGLLAFGLAAFFAAPGFIMLAIAATLLLRAKASETLPPMLEAFADFSERVNPIKLIAASAGILALGGALLGFAVAGVAAMAIATAGNVVGNLMTLGGLLGAPAPGPFDMLKMFIAFGNLSGQLKEGASAIEEIQSSMMKFALMDTEGMKDGVDAMVSAIDEFTRVLFRAKMFGGIGDTLLGGDPLESFIKLSESGSGIAAAAEGIKKLGETFVWFSGQKQHMAAFRGGMFTESMFENMMEDLTAGLDELDIEQFEEKIALMERLGNAIQNLTKSGSEFATKGGVDLKGLGSGDLKSMGSGRVTSDKDLGVSGEYTMENHNGVVTLGENLKGNSEALEAMRRSLEKDIKQNKIIINDSEADELDQEDAEYELEFNQEYLKAIQLEQLRLGKKPESKEEFNLIGELSKKERTERQLAMLKETGPRTDSTRSIQIHESKIALLEKAIAELAEIAPTIDEAIGISSEKKKNAQKIAELREYMKGDEEFFGSSSDADKEELARLEKNEVILKAKLLRLQVTGPRMDTLSSASAHDSKIALYEKAIAQNAILISQQKVTAGAGGSMNAPIIASKTINNQQSDTVLAASAITVNPESTLRQSARNVADDAIL